MSVEPGFKPRYGVQDKMRQSDIYPLQLYWRTWISSSKSHFTWILELYFPKELEVLWDIKASLAGVELPLWGYGLVTLRAWGPWLCPGYPAFLSTNETVMNKENFIVKVKYNFIKLQFLNFHALLPLLRQNREHFCKVGVVWEWWAISIPTSHPQSSPLWPCPWVLYTCSLMTFLLSPVIPSPPSLRLLSVSSLKLSNLISRNDIP